jgi:hypothetical protein
MPSRGFKETRSPSLSGVPALTRSVGPDAPPLADAEYNNSFTFHIEPLLRRTAISNRSVSLPQPIEQLRFALQFVQKAESGARLHIDTQVICLASPDKDRPVKFDSKEGTIIVWKRVKSPAKEKKLNRQLIRSSFRPEIRK